MKDKTIISKNSYCTDENSDETTDLVKNDAMFFPTKINELALGIVLFDCIYCFSLLDIFIQNKNKY